MIKTVYENQTEILKAIQTLHLPEGFKCDSTFGNGCFWKDIKAQDLKFDITPLKEGVIEADSAALPLSAGSLENIVFDPPFLTYVKNGRGHKNGSVAMSKRFGGYYSYEELEDHYRDSISEAYRVLKPGGKMVFKCQDIIHNHRMHCTHLNVVFGQKLKGSAWLICLCSLRNIECQARKREFSGTQESGTAIFLFSNVTAEE